MKRQDQQDLIQKQRSCYQFTIRINAIKLNVKFPCNMVLKYDSHPISPEVNKFPSSIFNFQHQIILKDSLGTGRFQIGVFLLTQKRQNSMIVNNTTQRSQMSTNNIFAGQIKLQQQKMMSYQGRSFDIGLTNCLDNSATCNLTVLRVQNLQQLRNGRNSVHKISDNEQSRMSRVQSSSILKHLSPKEASQISNEISSSIEKIRLRIDSRSKAQLPTPSTLSNLKQSAVEYRSQRSRENGRRVDSSTSLRPPLSPTAGYYLEKYGTVPTGTSYPHETNRPHPRQGLLQIPSYEHINSQIKIENPRSSSNQRKIQLALQRSQEKRSIQVNRLKSKIEELQKTLHLKDRLVKQQKDKINQLLQQNQSNKYFEQELNAKNTHIQSQQNTIKSLRQQNQSLKSQILQLQRQQQLMKQSFQTQRENLQNELQNLKQQHFNELKKKQSSINQLEFQLQVKSTQSSRMKRMIEELQERLDQKTFEAERDMRMLKQDNKRKIDYLNNFIKSLEQSLKSQAIKKAQLQAQVQKLKQLLISKQKQFYASFHQITFNNNSKSRINYDHCHLVTIRSNNNNLSSIMQSEFIENSLHPKGSEINQLPRNQQLQQKYFQVIKQNKLLKIDILSLNTTIDSLKKQNSNLNKQLTDMKEKLQKQSSYLNFGQQKYSQNDNFSSRKQLLSLKEQNEYLQQKLQSANNKLLVIQNQGSSSPSKSRLKASKLLLIQDKKPRGSKLSIKSVQDSLQEIQNYKNGQSWKQLIKDKNKQIIMLEKQIQLLKRNQSGKESLHRKTIQLKDFMIRQLEEKLQQKDNEILVLDKDNEEQQNMLMRLADNKQKQLNHPYTQQINKPKLQTEFEKLNNILDNIEMNSNINVSQVEYFRNQMIQKDKEIQRLKNCINQINKNNNLKENDNKNDILQNHFDDVQIIRVKMQKKQHLFKNHINELEQMIDNIREQHKEELKQNQNVIKNKDQQIIKLRQQINKIKTQNMRMLSQIKNMTSLEWNQIIQSIDQKRNNHAQSQNMDDFQKITYQNLQKEKQQVLNQLYELQSQFDIEKGKHRKVKEQNNQNKQIIQNLKRENLDLKRQIEELRLDKQIFQKVNNKNKIRSQDQFKVTGNFYNQMENKITQKEQEQLNPMKQKKKSHQSFQQVQQQSLKTYNKQINTSSQSQHQQPLQCQQHDFILQSYRLQNEQLQKQNKQLLNRLKQQQKQFMLRIQHIEYELKRGNNYRESLSKIDQGSNVEESCLDEKQQKDGKENSCLVQQEQSKIKMVQQNQKNVLMDQINKPNSKQLQEIQINKQQVNQNLITNPPHEKNGLEKSEEKKIIQEQQITENQPQTIQQLQDQLKNNQSSIEKYMHVIQTERNKIKQLKICLMQLIDQLKKPQNNLSFTLMKQKLIDQVENKLISLEQLQQSSNKFEQQQLPSLQKVSIENKQKDKELQQQKNINDSIKQSSYQSHVITPNIKRVNSIQKMQNSSQWRSLPLPQNISQTNNNQLQLIKLHLDPLMVGLSQSQLQQNILMQEQIKQLCQMIEKLENQIEFKNQVISKYEKQLQSKEKQLIEKDQLIQNQIIKNKLLKLKLKQSYQYQSNYDDVDPMKSSQQQQGSLKQQERNDDNDNDRNEIIVDDGCIQNSNQIENQGQSQINTQISKIQQKLNISKGDQKVQLYLQPNKNDNLNTFIYQQTKELQLKIQQTQQKITTLNNINGDQYISFKKKSQQQQQEHGEKEKATNDKESIKSKQNIQHHPKPQEETYNKTIKNNQNIIFKPSVKQQQSQIDYQVQSNIAQIDSNNNNINKYQQQNKSLLRQIDDLKNQNQLKQIQIHRLNKLLFKEIGSLQKQKDINVYEQKLFQQQNNQNNNKSQRQSQSQRQLLSNQLNIKIQPIKRIDNINNRLYYKKKAIKQPYQLQLYQHQNDQYEEQNLIQQNRQDKNDIQYNIDSQYKQNKQAVMMNKQQQRHQQLIGQSQIKDLSKQQQYQCKPIQIQQVYQIKDLDRQQFTDYNKAMRSEQIQTPNNFIISENKQQIQVQGEQQDLKFKDTKHQNKFNQNKKRDNQIDNVSILMGENKQLRQQLYRLKQQLNKLQQGKQYYQKQNQQQSIKIEQDNDKNNYINNQNNDQNNNNNNDSNRLSLEQNNQPTEEVSLQNHKQQQQLKGNHNLTIKQLQSNCSKLQNHNQNHNRQQNNNITTNDHHQLIKSNNNNKIIQLQLQIQQLYQQLYQLQYQNHQLNKNIKQQMSVDNLQENQQQQLLVNNLKTYVNNLKSLNINSTHLIYRISEQNIDQQHSDLQNQQQQSNHFKEKYQSNTFNREQFQQQNSVINIQSPFKQEQEQGDYLNQQYQQGDYYKQQYDQKHFNKNQRYEQQSNDNNQLMINEKINNKKRQSSKRQQFIQQNIKKQQNTQQKNKQIQLLKQNKIQSLQEHLSPTQLKINPTIQRNTNQYLHNETHQICDQNNLNIELVNRLQKKILQLQKLNKTYLSQLDYLREQLQKIKNIITIVINNNDLMQQNNKIDSKLTVFNHQNNKKNKDVLQYSNEKLSQFQYNNSNNNTPSKKLQQQNSYYNNAKSALQGNNNINKHQQQLYLNKQLQLKQVSNRKIYIPPSDSLVFSQTQINVNIKKQQQQKQKDFVFIEILRMIDNVINRGDCCKMEMGQQQQMRIRENNDKCDGQVCYNEQVDLKQQQQYEQQKERQQSEYNQTDNNNDKQQHNQQITQLLQLNNNLIKQNKSLIERIKQLQQQQFLRYKIDQKQQQNNNNVYKFDLIIKDQLKDQDSLREDVNRMHNNYDNGLIICFNNQNIKNAFSNQFDSNNQNNQVNQLQTDRVVFQDKDKQQTCFDKNVNLNIEVNKNGGNSNNNNQIEIERNQQQQIDPIHITKNKQTNTNNLKQLLLSDIQIKQQLKQMILQLIEQKQLISQNQVQTSIKLIQLQKQLNEYKLKIEGLRQQYIHRQQVMQNIQKDLHEFNLSMQTNQQSINEVMIDYQHKINVEIKREQVQHNNKVQIYSQQRRGQLVSQYDNKLKQQLQVINQLKVETRQLKQKVYQLQTQNSNNIQQITNLQSQTNSLKEHIHKYIQSQNNYKQKLTQYQQKIDQYQQQITNYQQQINTLITQLKQQQANNKQKDNGKIINHNNNNNNSNTIMKNSKNQVMVKNNNIWNNQQYQSKNNTLTNHNHVQSPKSNNIYQNKPIVNKTNNININQSENKQSINQPKSMANLITDQKLKYQQQKKQRVTSPRIIGSIGIIKKVDTHLINNNNSNINRLKKSSTNIPINNNSQ